MMPSRLLVDTHVLLWWRSCEPLQPQAREAIAHADAVYVSAASVLEAEIKRSLGRLELPASLRDGVRDSGFDELPIRFLHAEMAARLPPHHKDPFDRMLIAQALAEDLTLVTRDETFGEYDVALLRA